MSTSAILPASAAIAATFAASFTDIARATEALPYEIPGVAKFGYLPPAEHATEQMAPLLVLDGSPRPETMPDFRDAAMLHDILDTKWSDLTRGIDVAGAKVEGVTARDVRLFSMMFRGRSVRQIIAELDGSPPLDTLANILIRGSAQAVGNELNSLIFVAGAFEACSGVFSYETRMNMLRGIKIFRTDNSSIDLGEDSIPLPRTLNMNYAGASSIAGEAYADAVRRNGGSGHQQNFLRQSAADAWLQYLVLNGGMSPSKVEMVLNRAFNGTQVDPGGGHLASFFTYNNKAKPFEERVRNAVRAAWAGLMSISEVFPDADDPVSGVNWDDVQGNLMEVSELLGGDNPDIPKDEFDSAFSGIDKAELANRAAELANEAWEIGAEKYEIMRQLDDESFEDDFEEDDGPER